MGAQQWLPDPPLQSHAWSLHVTNTVTNMPHCAQLTSNYLMLIDPQSKPQGVAFIAARLPVPRLEKIDMIPNPT